MPDPRHLEARRRRPSVGVLLLVAVAAAVVVLLAVFARWNPAPLGQVRSAGNAAAASSSQPTTDATELRELRAEVASCRQLARVALGLGAQVVDAAIKHAGGHRKASKGKPIGDPRTLRPGTVWGDEWGPTLPVMHHGGKPAKEAAEAWRRECVK